MLNKHYPWLIPVVLMALITFFTPQLDLSMARFFYQRSGDASGHFSTNAFYDFMFEYGIIPAWLTVGLALGVLLFSYFRPTWKKYRSPALLLILTLAIGGGFITHVLLKDEWGRPRPRQVTEFGGTQAFRPFYQPNFFNQPEPSKSFPCGHCSMGFFFFSVALLGRRLGNSSLYWSGWALAIVLGVALGVTRIAQGGHFFSDVLMSALIMWLTALAFDWLLYPETLKYAPHAYKKRA